MMSSSDEKLYQDLMALPKNSKLEYHNDILVSLQSIDPTINKETRAGEAKEKTVMKSLSKLETDNKKEPKFITMKGQNKSVLESLSKLTTLKDKRLMIPFTSSKVFSNLKKGTLFNITDIIDSLKAHLDHIDLVKRAVEYYESDLNSYEELFKIKFSKDSSSRMMGVFSEHMGRMDDTLRWDGFDLYKRVPGGVFLNHESNKENVSDVGSLTNIKVKLEIMNNITTRAGGHSIERIDLKEIDTLVGILNDSVKTAVKLESLLNTTKSKITEIKSSISKAIESVERDSAEWEGLSNLKALVAYKKTAIENINSFIGFYNWHLEVVEHYVKFIRRNFEE